MSRVPDIEYSALQMLIEGEQAHDRAAASSSGWRRSIPACFEVVRRAGFDKQLGHERLMFNARTAIERYQALPAALHAGAPAGGAVDTIRPGP